MTKETFLSSLRRELSSLDKATIDEIMYDYEEHFNIGLENGKSEDEICKNLGNIKEISLSYKYEQIGKKAKENPTAGNIILAIFAGIGLFFFNMIFIPTVLFTLAGILFALFVIAIVFIFIGFAFLIYLFVPGLSTYFVFHTPFVLGAGTIALLANILTGIAMIIIGILCTILFFVILVGLIKLAISYIKMNINVIKKIIERN